MTHEHATKEAGEELIAWLGGVASEGEGIVREQAPLLAGEIISWHFWSGLVASAAWATVLATFVAVAHLAYRCGLASGDCETRGILQGLSAVLVLLATFPFCGVCWCLLDAAQAVIAPRVVIAEYFWKIL